MHFTPSLLEGYSSHFSIPLTFRVKSKHKNKRSTLILHTIPTQTLPPLLSFLPLGRSKGTPSPCFFFFVFFNLNKLETPHSLKFHHHPCSILHLRLVLRLHVVKAKSITLILVNTRLNSMWLTKHEQEMVLVEHFASNLSSP